jgi:hypothetical protein
VDHDLAEQTAGLRLLLELPPLDEQIPELALQEQLLTEMFPSAAHRRDLRHF